VIHRLLSEAMADPDREKHEQASLRAKAHLERLQRQRDKAQGQEGGSSDDGAQQSGRIEDLALNQYENIVAMDMVAPQDIAVGFDGQSTLNRSAPPLQLDGVHICFGSLTRLREQISADWTES
jgi:hypothetical protein